MRQTLVLLALCSLVLLQGCSKSADQPAATPPVSPAATPGAPLIAPSNAPATGSPAANSTAAKPKFDACTLLTSDEIKAVQGEAVKEVKPSDSVKGEFIVSQCYYELPTMSNSISLTLTESNSERRDSERVKDFWERTFGKDEKKSERERERQREKAKRAEPEGEEEEAPMEPVRGVGDEAFWSASSVGGALYVLKGDRFIRISVGGKGDIQAKLKKSKTLAQQALRHM